MEHVQVYEPPHRPAAESPALETTQARKRTAAGGPEGRKWHLDVIRQRTSVDAWGTAGPGGHEPQLPPVCCVSIYPHSGKPQGWAGGGRGAATLC